MAQQDSDIISMCGWCGKSLDGKPVTKSSVISHGICDACVNVMRTGKRDGTFNEIIDKFHFPILVIDGSGKVAVANKHALGFLKKEASNVEGLRGGDAINCVNSTLPGGCGKTKNCVACGINNSVMRTFNTNQGIKDVDVFREIVTKDGIQKVHFKLSTEKVDDTVVLKIELSEN